MPKASDAVGIASVLAIQEIEYLRKSYARATDIICENTPTALDAGRITYERVFTPDVVFKIKGEGIPAEDSVGPDAWFNLVSSALKNYAVTQHLIGTQLVSVTDLEIDDQGRVVAGEGEMTSYLQAWHATPDQRVWIFIGTYYDQVRYTADVGWQIYETTIEEVSSERRALGQDD